MKSQLEQNCTAETVHRVVNNQTEEFRERRKSVWNFQAEKNNVLCHLRKYWRNNFDSFSDFYHGFRLTNDFEQIYDWAIGAVIILTANTCTLEYFKGDLLKGDEFISNQLYIQSSTQF